MTQRILGNLCCNFNKRKFSITLQITFTLQRLKLNKLDMAYYHAMKMFLVKLMNYSMSEIQ